MMVNCSCAPDHSLALNKFHIPAFKLSDVCGCSHTACMLFPQLQRSVSLCHDTAILIPVCKPCALLNICLVMLAYIASIILCCLSAIRCRYCVAQFLGHHKGFRHWPVPFSWLWCWTPPHCCHSGQPHRGHVPRLAVALCHLAHRCQSASCPPCHSLSALPRWVRCRHGRHLPGSLRVRALLRSSSTSDRRCLLSTRGVDGVSNLIRICVVYN